MIQEAIDVGKLFKEASGEEDFFLGSYITKKLKTLEGYKKGSHFIPKMHTPAVDRFIAKAAMQEIQAEGEATVSRLRDAMNLNSDEYSYEAREEGVFFSCAYCRYQINAVIDENDLSQILFIDKLFPADTGLFKEKFPEIQSCLPFQNYTANFILASPISLENVLKLMEEDPNGNDLYSFEYPVDKSVIHIYLKTEGLRVTLQDGEANVQFPDREIVHKYIDCL
ncbi:MAG: hypothetical protein ABUK01_08195 [Leptospirales bacterium]